MISSAAYNAGDLGEHVHDDQEFIMFLRYG